MSIYDASIAPLYRSSEEYFDLQADGLTLFLNKLNERAMEFGWNENILLMENDPEQIGGDGTYLLDAHSVFPLEHIQAVERHYNATESRTSQNSHMLAKAILSSLTPEAVNRVNARKSDWVLSIDLGGEQSDMICGACLLKVVLIISQQETRSTMSHVIEQLNDLQPLMMEADYNIESFHVKVNELVNKILKAQKPIPENLLMSLFTAYQTVPDEDFIRFIRNKKDKYTDEELDLNPTMLMQAAEKKYYDLVNIQKTWRAPSEADKKIAALTATVNTLQKKLKKGKTTQSGNGSGKEQRKSAKPGKPDWLVKQIKPRNVKDTREWNNKTWRWCCPESGGKCKGKWVTHLADKCLGEAFRAKRNPDGAGLSQSGKPYKRKKKQVVAHEASTAEGSTIKLQSALSQAHADVCAQESEDEDQH